MTASSRFGISALSDGPVPTVPSALACAVCGWHALGADPETAHPTTTGRLVCRVCGAHRVPSP